MSKAKTRVLLADDHVIVRDGVGTLINSQDDMEVVGEVGETAGLLAKASELKPDVIVMDITMPGGGGLKAQEVLKRTVPGAKVIFLTMHRDAAYVRSAMSSGAAGYLTKAAAHTELMRAIRTVIAGKRYIDSTVSASLLPAEERQSKLTPRELQALKLFVTGHSYQEIAEKLCISVKTVETYKAHIQTKLQLRTRAEMYQYALNAGVLNDPE
jgi:two-component system, NarL family, response regulator NreC